MCFIILRSSRIELKMNVTDILKFYLSDGGGEYLSHEFSNYLNDCGVRHQFTCKYTPQQNGVAEREIDT